MGQAETGNTRCPRCGSQWHADCYDDFDEDHEPTDGWLLLASILISWAVVISIGIGIAKLIVRIKEFI